MRVILFYREDCEKSKNVEKFLTEAGIKFEIINPFNLRTFKEDEFYNLGGFESVPSFMVLDDEERVLLKNMGVRKTAYNELIRFYNGEDRD